MSVPFTIIIRLYTFYHHMEKGAKCHRRKCSGGVGGKSRVRGAQERFCGESGIGTQLKDGTVTGGDGKEKNILVFPKGMSGWA